MNVLKCLSLLILFAIGVLPVSAQENEPRVALTLERTACFGTCPVYTVTILEDGTVIYHGESSVETLEEQVSEIAPETVTLMVEAFADAGYFDWDETYTATTVSDVSTVITSVTRAGETHRIERTIGDSTAPLALSFLETWIDAMVNTSLWTGVQPDITGNPHGSEIPLITLQRSPNFGIGPVYTVAAYQDGTIVYTGIAHVTTIGVHIFDSEPSVVANTAQRAELSGYFNWQDNYEQRLITDQATIITSIRWANQFKRIIRYDGDPNAPIGLVRIEASIDLLVTDLVGG